MKIAALALVLSLAASVFYALRGMADAAAICLILAVINTIVLVVEMRQ